MAEPAPKLTLADVQPLVPDVLRWVAGMVDALERGDSGYMPDVPKNWPKDSRPVLALGMSFATVCGGVQMSAADLRTFADKLDQATTS